jgi:3,4-dihydroxy 2-butanone 4-phosphate synthase/GTP cyclohydrolase II
MRLTDEATDSAVSALARGELIVLCDDAKSRPEGYLCGSGRRIDAPKVNFMVTHARGLVCLAMSESRMRQLGIPQMATDGRSNRQPAFAASIEAARNVTTGISAADRAATILAASAPEATTSDVVMPGHVFPLLARSGGVLARHGVAEAALDLVSMACEGDTAVLCAILDISGNTADSAGLRGFADSFHLALITVTEVVADRLRRELIIERVAERMIQSGDNRNFRAIVYRSDLDGHEHMALVAGDLSGEAPVDVRIHSQCLTGDVLGSTRCDCGEQLGLALETIARHERGVVIYMHQEGRGIGLANKIRAYALQDEGRDTVEANLELGFKEDLRDYGVAAQIIKDLRIARVRLLTNNPHKLQGLRAYGINVVERVALESPPHEGNIAYLRTKREKLGHWLDADRLRSISEDDE